MVRKSCSGAARRSRALALLLAAALPATLVPVGAAEKIGDGVTPTYDEAYYATVDYYGNLTEGSVVKSYALNGAASLTDYGAYDEVVNLTDGTVPAAKDGETTFDFSGENAPSHFYFEGKTARPFDTLPWKVSLSYTLNGVPAKAEELAGKTGRGRHQSGYCPQQERCGLRKKQLYAGGHGPVQPGRHSLPEGGGGAGSAFGQSAHGVVFGPAGGGAALHHRGGGGQLPL